MAGNADIEKLYLRLLMFSHKISLPVVRTFFVSSVLGQSPYNNDIDTFFEHHKHELFHLMGDYKCCKCSLYAPLQKRISTIRLGKDQFRKLYETGLSHPGHVSKGSGGKIFHQCLCCVSVKKDTTPKNYDITLLLTILQNCGQLSDNHRLWLDTIRKCRNRLCHLNEITDLTENEIHSLWGKLQFSTLQLAGEIPPKPNYKESIESQIEILKDADYSWNTVTPIMEAMKSDINNNMKRIIQNQIIADEDLKCLKTNVEQLSRNFKKDSDNTDIFQHVSSSAKTIMYTQQDELSRLSAKVDQCHLTDVKHQKKVSGLLVHAMQKINCVAEIANHFVCTEGIKPLHTICPCHIQPTENAENKKDAATINSTFEGSSVKCFMEETNYTTFVDRAVQAVPAMIDQSIEAMGTDIFPTSYYSAKGLSSESSCYSELKETNSDRDVDTAYSHLARTASTDTCSYSELDLSRVCCCYCGSLIRECGSCKLLMQKLSCEATKQFWREIDNEGPIDHQSCHVKFFEIFLERLKDAFPTEEGLEMKSTIRLLKFLLKVDPKDLIAGINLFDLKRITDLFGPIKEQDGRCELIRQLHLLTKRSLKRKDRYNSIKSSWFVGDMTREEAENCLLASDCKEKSYLVRISGAEADDGDFTLSVRHEDHCHHLLIKGDPKTALSESPYNAHLKFAGREFSSLPDVMDYVTHTQEIKMDTEDETGECSSVMCLRVFSKSPLNGAMSGCEKTK